MKSRIMYIEEKSLEGGLLGVARIGRVEFSKTGKSIYYDGKTFQSTKEFKANYVEISTGTLYWISGCKKDGTDRLYGERLPIYIDDDVREEYWVEIRKMPEKKDVKAINVK